MHLTINDAAPIRRRIPTGRRRRMTRRRRHRPAVEGTTTRKRSSCGCSARISAAMIVVVAAAAAAAAPLRRMMLVVVVLLLVPIQLSGAFAYSNGRTRRRPGPPLLLETKKGTASSSLPFRVDNNIIAEAAAASSPFSRDNDRCILGQRRHHHHHPVGTALSLQPESAPSTTTKEAGPFSYDDGDADSEGYQRSGRSRNTPSNGSTRTPSQQSSSSRCRPQDEGTPAPPPTHPQHQQRRPYNRNTSNNNVLQFQNRKRARLSSIVKSVEALVRLQQDAKEQQVYEEVGRRVGVNDDGDHDGSMTAAGGPPPPGQLASGMRWLLDARTQADVVEAGLRIEALLFEPGAPGAAAARAARAASYSPRVLDLVLRGVALTGLIPLASRLWDHLVERAQQQHLELDDPAAMPSTPNGSSGAGAAGAAARSVKVSDGPIPSYTTQEVVCHTFRRAGRLALLRHVFVSLQGLASDAKSSTNSSSCGPLMSPVAVNMVLAAHCEADPQDGGGLEEAYRILRAGLETSSPSPSPSSSSSAAASDRQRSLVEVDAVTFATVLQACARSGNATLAQQVWDDMATHAQNVTPNVVAYNARLQLALQHPATAPQSSRDQAALKVWMELIEAVQPDQYSINWIAMPLLRTGKVATLGIILNHFVAENSQQVASLAFSAFLTTVVQSGHIQAAHKMFDKYLLPSLSPIISGPVNSIRLVRPTTRHFNVLLSGFQNQHHQQLRVREAKHRVAATFTSGSTENQSTPHLDGASATGPSPRDEALKLYRLMQTTQDCQPNEITRTILLSMSASSEEIVDLVSDELEQHTEQTMRGSVLRAAIMAAGTIGDASLAAWLHAALEATVVVTSKEERGVRMWNVLVGAMANDDAAAYHEANEECPTVDVLACTHKYGSRRAFSKSEVNVPSHEVIQIFNGRTIPDGFRCYLNRIQHGGHREDSSTPPTPNSQTYCLLASVFQRRCPSPDLALSLFRNATRSHGVPADGRFVNAVLRCFGNDLDRALEAWKGEIRPATLAHDARYRSSSSMPRSAAKKTNRRSGPSSSGKSLTAAYHGLLYVCGRAAAPQMALRVVYAMRRDGLDPDETALNCYHSGKHDEMQIHRRLASDESPEPSDAGKVKERKVDTTGWTLRRIKDTLLGKDRNPYESLLLVECTQYNPNDRRRIGEQRVRIIV